MSSVDDHVIYNKNKHIKILTYNLGLLDYHLFSIIKVFSNPPHSDLRLPFIPHAIRRENADIVAIQECYSSSDYKYIINKLKDIYPYNSREKSGGLITFHNGLLILSKYKIISQKLIPYTHVSNLESILASKSSLLVTIEIEGFGNISVINIHTTAGGELDPENSYIESIRETELDESINELKRKESLGHHCILLGDINCGPEASNHNYEYILNQGFRDLYTEAITNEKATSKYHYTWDPENYLNKSGPHSHTPPQRIDTIMLSKNDLFWNNWVVSNASVVFTEPVVPIDFKRCCTISDHYGLLVDIVCNNES